MNTSAAIANSPLRRAWTRLARAQAGGLAVQSVNKLLGTGALFLGACPRSESNGTGTAADGGASPLGSARMSRWATARFRNEPS